MRSNLKPLESFTRPEDGVHARPLSTRKQLSPADSHCVEISKALQHIYGTTGSNRSWKGEESPVSVIGHAARSNNMNIMQVAASQPSSGSCTSSNMKHPPAANGFSPPPTPPANNSSSATNCPYNQNNHALIISNDPPANSNLPESASKYAELLSERVQQAFRKSHELTTPVVKTWPVSTTSKRMEWLNLPEEPPAFINASELSKVFHSLKGRSTASNSAAAPAGSTTNVSTRVLDDQASSEEDGLSMTYSSSRKDYEEDEEDNSVIDFFPAINRRDTQSRRGSKGRHNEKMRVEDCSSNELGTDTIRAGPGALIMKMRRSSACRAHPGAAGAAGGLRLPISHHDVAVAENHVDEEEGSRVSTSYKWDDAERWLTASPTTSTSGRSAPAAVLAAGSRLHPIGINNRDGSVKAAHYPQLVQVHTRKPLCDPASTQDKHVAEGRGSALDGVDMREAATEFDRQRKKDMATQSTPAEWSSCDSPDEERAVLTLSSATADHLVKHSPRHPGAVEYNKYSTGPVDKEAPCTQMRTSPPRHNTPARRSVSCNQQRGSRYIVPSDCVLSIYSSTSGKLNLRELESCHLDKLKLARDIPLGTSETWQLFAEEEDGMDSSSDQKYLLERKSPAATSQHVHHVNHLSKVNMLEARVSAWEDVERAKHLAKFKRDEAKIEAWESLQRAEAEAELRKLEVKLEKMRFEGREKIMGKLGAAQKRVQEMRRVVEVQKAEQLTRVAMRANHIRKSGNFPSSAFNVMCSLTTKIKPSSNLSFS